jgi:hypothetical protein
MDLRRSGGGGIDGLRQRQRATGRWVAGSDDVHDRRHAGDVGNGVQLELLRNGEVSGIPGELLTVPADGTFTCTRTVTNADTWLVKVFLQPSGFAQWCIANNASGSAAIANVTTVQVNCTTNAFIGGTVTGLAGSGLTLGLFFNPQADEPMSVGADGPSTFAIL